MFCGSFTSILHRIDAFQYITIVLLSYFKGLLIRIIYLIAHLNSTCSKNSIIANTKPLLFFFIYSLPQ